MRLPSFAVLVVFFHLGLISHQQHQLLILFGAFFVPRLRKASLLSCGLFFLLGMAWGTQAGWQLEQEKQSIAKHLFYHKYHYQARVIRVHKLLPPQQVAHIRTQTFRRHGKDGWKVLSCNLLLKLDATYTLRPNDIIRFRGKIRPHRSYSIPGLYDRQQLWERRGIPFQIRTSSSTLLLLQRKTSLLPSPSVVREKLIFWFSSKLPSKATKTLILAILFGERSWNPTMMNSFSRTGTSHLLAISGLHISLIATFFYVICFFFCSRIRSLTYYLRPQKVAAIVSLLGSFLYLCISGFPISAQRAFLMLACLVLAKCFDRKLSILNSLAVAAFLISLRTPFAIFELSFQLSFAAVLSLVIGIKVFQSSQTHQGMFWACFAFVKASLLSSTIALLGTLPISLTFSPHIPLHSPVANLLAIPLSGLVLTISMCTAFLGLFSMEFQPLFSMIDFLSKLLCSWIETCAANENFLLSSPSWSACEKTLYFLSLGLLCSLWKRWWKASVATTVVMASILLFSFLPPRPIFTVQMLDIGQGDSLFLRLPNRQTMLIDGGGEAYIPFDVGKQVLLPFLRHQRVNRIDYMVLSHPHPDHFGGLLAVAKEYPIGEFWHTGEKAGGSVYKELLQRLKKKNVPIRTFPKPTTLQIGGVEVNVLHPFPGKYEGKGYYWALDANDNSLTLQFRFGKFSLLCLGDLEERGEELLVTKHPMLKTSILKVPHHGSRTSSTDLLLRNIKAKHAIVSLGFKNLFRFPHPEVIKRYKRANIPLWRTDKHGTIGISSNGQRTCIHGSKKSAHCFEHKTEKIERKTITTGHSFFGVSF